MQRFVTAIVFFLVSVNSKCHTQPSNSTDTIVRVIDGDTVQLSVQWLPAGLPVLLSLRVTGVDAPEISKPKCDAERALGLLSKFYVERLLSDLREPYQLVYCGWDKYGGRILGDVVWQGGTVSLSDCLLRSNHAVAYDGKHAKTSTHWCSSEENKK